MAEETNYNTTIKEVAGEKTPEDAINNLAKAIFEKTSLAITSAAKTILPSIPKIIDDLTQKIESGSIKNMNVAFSQLESIVKNLGIDLGMYNEKLAKTLQEREERAIKSQEKVDKLREVGVIAKVNKTTKEVEILTKTQIDTEKELLKTTEKKILQIEKEIEKGRKTLQTKDTLSPREKGDLKKQIETQITTLETQKIQAQQSRETLNLTADTGGDRLELPPMLANLKDAFLSPITAVGDAFGTLKDQVKGIGESFLFLGKAGIKGISVAFQFLSKILKPIPLAIGAAIAGAIFVIYKFRDNIMNVIDFIKGIPTKVSDFLKGVFTQISDFFKTGINAIIKLINKIPGIEIPLLQTSDMKKQVLEEEKEKTEAKKIATEEKKNNYNFDDVEQDTIIPPRDTNDNIIINPDKIIPLKESKPVGVMARYQGFDSKDNLNALSKEMNQLSKTAPVVINNATQSNIANSGTTISGTMNQKNVDDTFLNLNTASV